MTSPAAPAVPAPPPTQLQYWRFYWPLVLTGVVMLLAQQFQNSALARYPDAARELAVFAFASSVFHLFNAALIFTPQMSNSFARSPRGWQVCLRFTVWTCLALTLPLALMAFTGPGRWLVGLAFGVEGEILDDVILYLRWLTPLLLVSGLRSFYTGMLVQCRRTALVTLLNLGYLGAVVAVLLGGHALGWKPILTIALSQLAAAALHLALTYACVRRCYALPAEPDHESLTYAEVFSYFWGTALTSVMFSLSRPIIYSFLNRIPDPTPVVAAMRVGFDFSMIFHNALNQFRHLFVTFGEQDLAGVRRFMIRVSASVVGAMVVVAATPASRLVLEGLVGVKGQILEMTCEVVLVMCLLPVVVNVRNYYHGLALIRRTTGRMGAGAICRNLATYLLTALCFYAGLLNHVTATLILIAGFVAETLVMVAGAALGRADRRDRS